MYLMDIRSLFILFFPFVIMSLWFLTITEYFALDIVPKAMVVRASSSRGIYLAYNDTDYRATTGKTVQTTESNKITQNKDILFYHKLVRLQRFFIKFYRWSILES